MPESPDLEVSLLGAVAITGMMYEVTITKYSELAYNLQTSPDVPRCPEVVISFRKSTANWTRVAKAVYPQ